MSSEQEVKRIEAYSLYEFCQKIQEAIQEGWKFDFETNANFPVTLGTMITAGLKKDEHDEVVKVEEVVKPKQAKVSAKKVAE